MTYYIATNGSDTNPGTIDKPFKTIEKIASLGLLPGDIVFVRAGTYLSTAPATASACTRITGKNGTQAAPIIISAYPADFVNGGRVLYDCTNVAHSVNCFGIDVVNCSWINFVGIYVKGPGQTIGAGTGTITGAWWSRDTSNNQFINCEGSHSMSGFRLDGGSNTTFINCDAHEIDDPYTGPPTGKHNNSDGFSRTGSGNAATNTLYRGCRSWWCSDDGWDSIHTDGTITYDHCWSFWNGYKPGVYPLTHTSGSETYGDGNGYKMSSENGTGLTRFVNNCIAANNYFNGFDQTSLGKYTAQFYNNTSFGNGNNDWKFGYNPPIAHQFRNNLSYKCKLIGNSTGDATYWNPNDHNSWNGFTVTDADFISLDDQQLIKPRKANGDLPDITFLHLAPGSKLIDKGINVGFPFTGIGPDIGAFEAGGVTPPQTFTNVAVSKSFTKNNCVSGAGSSVVYAVPAGKYSASTQAAADQLATDDINNNGQNYANLNGVCTAKTITKVVIYYNDGTTNTQT